jgi:hypothetical protein
MKSSEVSEVFFLVCPFKNGSSTSGNSVKKRKNRKYDDSYLDFGSTSTKVDGEERPHCVLCMKVVASESMLPS